MIKFKIKNQSLSIDTPIIVSDTIKYLTASFDFSSDWMGYTKILHAKNNDTVYDFPIDNNEITMSDNLSLTQGVWEFYLHGILGESRITTTSVFAKVIPFGNPDGEMYPNVPQSVLDRLLLIIQLDGDGTKFLSDDGTYRTVQGSAGSVEWGAINGDIQEQTDLISLLLDKVDKVEGKGLSTNDFTNEDKTKLNNAITEHQSLTDYATKSWVENKGYLTQHQDISNKVDKVNGKGLSTNDFTDAYKTKLDNALTQHQSLEDYATKTYVDTAITNAIGGALNGSY